MVCRTALGAWCVLCIVLFALAQLPGAANTYYVSTAGSDSNDGSIDNPWATIDKGDRDSVLSPGDEVVILAGTYDVSGGGGIVISKRSGTAVAPITYRADGEVILDRGTSGGSLLTFYTSYIVLDGVRFKGGITTLVFTNCAGCEIKDCWISSKIANYPTTWGPALMINGTSSSFKVHNNVIGPDLPWPSHGICYDASGGDSKFYNNVIMGATDWTFVARVAVTGVEFKNNIIYNASNGIYSQNPNLVHSHNILYGTTGTPYMGTAAGPGETTDDPLFNNTSGNFSLLSDFELQAGSPAIDSGTYVGLPFNGSKPDRGVFETSGAAGQVGTVDGTVTDGSTSVPLAGAVVQLKDGTDTVFEIATQPDGSYSFQWIIGTYTVAASYAGYRPASAGVTVTDGGTSTVNFGLVAATPTTFYVSPSGDDGNDGLTVGTAWATMDKGDRDNVLIAGDTVRIQAGTYSGRQVTLSKKSGASASPITYVGDGGPIIDRADYNGTTFSMTVNALHDLVFDGITYTGGTGGVQLNDCEGLEMKNCTVRDLQLPTGSGSYSPGIHSIRTGSSFIHNNLLYGTLGNVIVQDFGGNGNRYFNNTIYAYNTCTAFICGWAKGYGGDPTKNTGAQWKNNICYTGGGYGLRIYTPLNHSNNLFWPAGNGNVCDGSTGSPLPFGPGDLAADPMFVDEWIPDLHLKAGSPAIDAGTLVGLPFNGGWPDIGALETAGTPNPGTMGTVTGKVTDAVSSTPIAGATVAAGPNSNITTTTDGNGDYTFQVLQGSQSISASKILYYTQTKTDTVTSGTITVSFALQPVPPKEYYVSTTGSDGNDGSLANPWATIDKGDRDSILAPGDTVIVLPGTYNLTGGGDAPPFAKCSGLPGRPITYRSQDKWGAILDRGTDGGTTLAVRGPSHIVIDGFQLIHGRIPIATVNSDDIEIKNCWIHDKNHAEGGWGIWLLGSKDCRIHHNVIGPNMLFPCHGIDDYADSRGGHKIYNNTIVGTTDWAFVTRSAVAGVEFKNNIIYGVNNGIHNANSLLVRSHNMYFGVTGAMFLSGGLALGESVADPTFVNAGANDYTLASGSPAIDAGALVGFAFNGSWPDIGAFETAGAPGALGGAINGRVTNAATGVGLIGATVAAGPNNNAYALTDADGNYAFQLPTGTYDVTASAAGFTSAMQQAIVGTDPQTLNFALQPTPAQTYYVSPTGSDTNSGSFESPWATIDKGDRDNVVNPGDTVRILPGTYVLTAGGDGPTFINRPGTANRPITYTAYGGPVVVDTVALPGGAARIYVSYIVLDGIHLKGGFYGLYVSDSVGAEVRNCFWSDKEPGWPTIIVRGVSAGFKFHNNLVVPGDFARYSSHCHGIWDESTGGSHKFYNNTLADVSDWGFISIVSTSGVEIRNNVIQNTFSGSIYGAGPVHSHNLLSTTGANYGGGASAGASESAADPLFVNPAADDYRLRAGSPAIDTGIDVGLPFVGLAADRGAYEFSVFESSKIGELLGKSDGTSVKLTTSVVTVASGVFLGSVIYVEDESRAAGIRVHAPASPAVVLGDRVSVEGTMTTTSAGERMIEATAVTFISSGSAIGPLGTIGRAVGGNSLDDTGLLVKIWGNVTFKAPDDSYFCVDDGSGKSDGLGHAGIPVVASDLVSGLGTVPSSGYALVTGVVGAKDLGGGAVPVVRVRGDDDID